MDDWVLRAMQRWPNVPYLFGWLGLDRRGRWLIKGEIITHPRIVQTISRNYAHDEHGRWFFQNGPQRGFIQLESTPYILSTTSDGRLVTHNELEVSKPTQAFLDEEGALLIETEHGLGELASNDMEWALSRISRNGQPLDEAALAEALELASGAATLLSIDIGQSEIPIRRLSRSQLPVTFGFEPDPQPRPGERTSSGAPD